MRDGPTDVISGLVVLTVAGVGLRALAGTTGALVGFDFGADPGPALLPRLLLWALGLGGAWFVASGGWRLASARRRPGGEPPARPSGRGRYAVLVLFAASLVGYVWGLFAVGFVAASVGFCFVWIAVLTRQIEGRFDWRRALASAAAAIAVTASVYYVFKGFVRVPLP